MAVRRFIQATWLPATVFAVLMRMSPVGGREWPLSLVPSAIAAVTIALAWRFFVVAAGRPRLGRAALAGAMSGFLVPALELVLADFRYRAQRVSPGDLPGEELGAGLTLFIYLFALLIGGSVGSGVGVLIAVIQRRWSPPAAESSEVSRTMRDGALGGAMLAVLAAPVVGLLAATGFPEALKPTLPHGSLDVGGLLLWSWGLLVPIAAVAGALGARRWQRIMRNPTVA